MALAVVADWSGVNNIVLDSTHSVLLWLKAVQHLSKGDREAQRVGDRQRRNRATGLTKENSVVVLHGMAE